MKYLSIMLLWLVILTGTWTEVGQDLFGPTYELRTISKINKAVEREPSYSKNEANQNLIKANELLTQQQFDKAVVQYEYGLSDRRWAQDHQKEWNENVQTLLGLTLRVRNDPSLTYELISTFLEKGSVPESLKPIVTVWRSHAREWSRSMDNGKNSASNIDEIRELLKRAEQLQHERSGPVSLVLYLRSAALLDSVFSASSQNSNQEALLLAGRSAEGLKDHQNVVAFYQKCVDLNPNSESGQFCRERLSR